MYFYEWLGKNITTIVSWSIFSPCKMYYVGLCLCQTCVKGYKCFLQVNKWRSKVKAYYNCVNNFSCIQNKAMEITLIICQVDDLSNINLKCFLDKWQRVSFVKLYTLYNIKRQMKSLVGSWILRSSIESWSKLRGPFYETAHLYKNLLQFSNCLRTVKGGEKCFYTITLVAAI